MMNNLNDLFSIKGKVAIVTGGSRGIGEMIATGFVASGVKVYIISRKSEVCEITAERLSKDYGGQCIPLSYDVSKISEIDELYMDIFKKEKSIDILVNNAGVSWGASLEEFPEHGWDKVMDLNVKSPFFIIQKFLPLLESRAEKNDPSRIINIGSIDGIKRPIFNNFSYASSKAAIHHLTKVLAAHLVSKNILVNAIAPGPFPTWMLSTGVGFKGEVENVDWDLIGRNNPRGRVGSIEDIVGLAIFLSSRAGAYIVGETITCDGGMTIC